VEKTLKVAPTVMDGVTQINIESQNSLGMNKDELCYAEVPVDFFRYFDLDMGRVTKTELSRLKDVAGWVKERVRDGTLGEQLQEMREVERRLGSSHVTEKRHDRLWNWLRMERHITDMRKRQSALERNYYV
jgi:hypothetical protein